MSLEQTLERTNELLAQVITILQTGIQAPAALGEPEKTTRTRKSKSEPVAETPATTDAVVVTKTPKSPLGLVDGDPEGTRYFVIEKHNSVYAQKPGDPDCTVPGALIVSAEEYAAKKAQFAAMTQKILSTPAQPATEPAAAPAPSTPAASTASSQPSAQTQADVPFSKVVEAMTAMSKSDKPGHGREGVLGVLKKYLPGDDRPTVTKLQPLGINAEIVAHVESLLAPAAETDFDPLA